MTEKNKKAPPPAEIFTLKDYQEMRRFSHEMEKAIKQFKQNRIKAEEWDEAFNEFNETGEFSAKYKKRIEIQTMPNVRTAKPVYDDAGNPVLNKNGTVKLEPVTTEEPEIIIRYNDKAQRIFREKANRLGKKYQKIISKVNATQTGTPKKRNSINRTLAIMRTLLNTPEAIQTLEKLDILRLKPIDSIPSGEVVFEILRTINLENPYRPPEKNPNTSEEINSTYFQGALTYTRKAKNSSLEIKYNHFDEIKKHKTLITSLLIFVLQKANQQGYPSTVEISLNEMVDLGMYSTTNRAKYALIHFVELQRYIGIKGKIKKGKKQISSVKRTPQKNKNEATATDAGAPEEMGMGGIIFGNYRYEKNYFFIDISINLNADFLAAYTTYFHRDGHLLSGKSQLLYLYICYIARQNLKKIKEEGRFIISINSVRIKLNLPSIKEIEEDYQLNEGKKYNGDYKRHIFKPIDDAIKGIEEVIPYTPEAQNLGFTITPITDYYDTENIYDFVNGKLEIGMKGEYAKPFIEIAEKSEKKRRQRERAKAKMIEAPQKNNTQKHVQK